MLRVSIFGRLVGRCQTATEALYNANAVIPTFRRLVQTPTNRTRNGCQRVDVGRP